MLESCEVKHTSIESHFGKINFRDKHIIRRHYNVYNMVECKLFWVYFILALGLGQGKSMSTHITISINYGYLLDRILDEHYDFLENYRILGCFFNIKIFFSELIEGRDFYLTFLGPQL